MSTALRISSRLLVGSTVLVLVGCGGSGSTGTTAPGGCTPHYEPVAAAASERALTRLLQHDVDPHVTAVTVAPHEPADGKQTVKLLDKNKQVVRSLDMWRKADGTWVAQQRKQCTD